MKGEHQMPQFLPGTKIEAKLSSCDAVLASIFATGGLVLSQVCIMTGLEPHTVQNWVKRGFVSSPQNKKYSKNQFCRIATINMLKDSLPLDQITRLLSYINGQLDDESDDMIDDSQLYSYFTALLHTTKEEFSSMDSSLAAVLRGYREPFAGGKTRLEKALRIMGTAYLSAFLKQRAMLYLSQLDQTNG